MTVHAPEKPPVPNGRRSRRRIGPPAARRWRWVYPIVLVGLALCTVVFSIAGAQFILDSRDGQVARAVTDPTQPGYLASVAATPTMLVVLADDNGDFFGAVVLTLGNDGVGGGAAVLPPELYVRPEPDADGRALADIYEESGVEDINTGAGVRSAISLLLGAEMDSVLVLDSSTLAPLIEPVAPLRYSLADPVRGTSGGRTVTLLPAGAVEISTADDIEAATQVLGPDEDPARRAQRQQRFWQAWIDAVRTSSDPAAAFPATSADTQIARFVTGMGAGNAVVNVVPYVHYVGVLVPDTGDLPAFAQKLVPLPRHNGVRVSVAVYNGVGNIELNKTVNRDLVAAGAQILSIGNTRAFDVDRSSVAYHRAELESKAEELADAIGVSDVRFDDKPESAIDVTVTIGSDYSP